jgi:Transposase zinc-ribbon domain
MSGFLAFMDRYRDEAACIAALAELRWPDGFLCAGCAGRTAYQLASRPRVFECAGCGQQQSVTAGTVFHRTRTPLRKWFAAAWLIGQDKRGVSALFLARELALRYATAWLMAHKLRHGLSERPEYPLDGLIEIDESYYGGRGKPESRGRGGGTIGNFVRRLGMIGGKEPVHAATQRTSYPGRRPRPAAGRRRSQNSI